MALKRDLTTGEAIMNERRAIVLGQLFTILAVVLLIASRWGNTYRDVAHILGIDSLILAAVVLLLVSSTLVVYTLCMAD